MKGKKKQPCSWREDLAALLRICSGCSRLLRPIHHVDLQTQRNRGRCTSEHFRKGKKNANSVLMVHTNKWWLHGVIGHFFAKINNLVGRRHVSGGSEGENHFKNQKTPQRCNLNSCKSGSTESFLSSMCDNRMKIRCSPGFKVEMWPAQVINCCGDTASIPRHCNKLNSWREEVPVDPIKYYFLWKTWSEINLKPFQGWQRLKLGLKRHYVSSYYHYWHQPTLNLVVETQSTPSTEGS